MSIVDKAKALLTLKAALGPVFEIQKKQLIDQALALPLSEAAVTLNELLQISFIDSKEIVELSTRLITGVTASPAPTPTPAPAPSPTPAPAQAPKPVSPTPAPPPSLSDITPTTPLNAVVPVVAELGHFDPAEVNQLIEETKKCEVHNVAELFQFDDKDKQFNLMEDLIGEENATRLRKMVEILRGSPAGKAEQEKKEQLEASKHKDKLMQKQVHNYWKGDSQAIVLPVASELYFFSSFEAKQKVDSEESGSEHVIFCLDISSSMNHNETGEYRPPKSPDHPASSIKKARELIPPLAMNALKRHAPFTLIVWSQTVKSVIEFKPSEFIDAESGEFIEDAEIEKQLRLRTSDTVFTASGGTNIHAALKFSSDFMLKIAPKLSNITAWFLTDGEETFYLDEMNTPTRIPTSTSFPSYKDFNVVGPDGLTKHQKDLARYMGSVHANLREMNCSLEFHVCHFGEAHPIFLGAIRQAVDGHFHAVADINKLKTEMSALATTTSDIVQISAVSAQNKYNLSAAVSEGAVYVRGKLPLTFLTQDLKSSSAVSIVYRREELLLDEYVAESISDKLLETIGQIIALETSLGDIIQGVSNDISHKSINRASKELNELRKRRIEVITVAAKLVSNGSMLQIFVEKVLESVQNQMEALERMLSQHFIPEGAQFDTSFAKNADFFNSREQLAIAAGLESMKVRLCSGFVTKSNLDRRVQRLVAQHGPWARKMLARRCFVVETVCPVPALPSITSPSKYNSDYTCLSVIIVDGSSIKGQQNSFAKRLAMENEKAKALVDLPGVQFSIKENMVHKRGEADLIVLWSEVKVTMTVPSGEIITFEGGIKTEELYEPVATYSTCVLTNDLEDANDRMRDPLSYSGLIDLIRDNNTLPAYLYTVSPDQSIGLIYNAKEMVHVISGGMECTSFGYFRLYWRLAEKTVENGAECVKVPGHFHFANYALPIAPEPLTSAVLVSLMPGLLSEFVTGTPIAPLTESGLLYIGYLLMHMRGSLSSVDVTRIAEILCTIKCWIENPKTKPKVEEMEELLVNMTKTNSIASGDSPGKNMPVKAFAYSLLNDSLPIENKFQALLFETLRRNFKLICGKMKGTQNQKINPKIKENQISSRKFMRTLITEVSEHIKVPPGPDPEIPVSIIETSRLIQGLLTTTNEQDVLSFFSNEKVLTIFVKLHVWTLHEIGSKCFGASHRWSSIIRLFFVWFQTISYPIADLAATFSAFKAPTEFENHLIKRTECLKKNNQLFAHSLFPIVQRNGSQLEFVTIDYTPDNALCSVNHTTGKTEPFSVKSPHFFTLWLHFKETLSVWPWRGRASNAFGVLKLDYDIVRALKDPMGMIIETLNQGQIAEYHAAREGKNKSYEKWAPTRQPTIQLAKDDQKVYYQSKKVQGDKPKLGLVIIGNVDAGKSTTTGHLITELGFIDDHVIRAYEEAARKIGKLSFKFAWVMDKLKNEREMGLTIEVGFWNIATSKFNVDILDSPGHRNFVKNMAAGASMADAAVLVVSAAPQEFEAGIMKGGMTREESIIAYSCGVRQFIVAVNKMDTVGYSEQRFKEVSTEIINILKKYGIAQEKIAAIPVSGYVGDNLICVSKVPELGWWQGWPMKTASGAVIEAKTLVEAIDLIIPPVRSTNIPLRMPIQKAFQLKGVGTLAIGRVATGTIKPGDHIKIDVLSTTSEKLTVGTIETNNTNRDEVGPGELVAVQVKGVSAKLLRRGMVISHLNAYPAARVVRFTAQMAIMQHPGELKVGYTPYFHCHTDSFPGKWVEIVHTIDKRTNGVKEKNPRCVKQGEMALVVIEPVIPVVLETFSEFPPLGRFVMRDAFTVGFGIIKAVEKQTVAPPKHPAGRGGRGVGRGRK